MEVTDVKFYLRKRYFVTFFVFLGWISMYLMRTNLSISIIDMTSDKVVTDGNKSTLVKAEFSWTSQEKGLILSAFTWGYMTAPVGAVVANKFGPVLTFGIGITLTGVLTILTPFLIAQHFFIYLIGRILEGILEGFAASSFVDILKVWSSPTERTRTITSARCGSQVALFLGYPICGTIAYYLNWKAIFYIIGGGSLIWSILWFTIIKSHPQGDGLMSSQEKKYLEQVNGPTLKRKVSHPWKKMFLSKAVWAYWNNRFVEAWPNAFINYSMPLFIQDMHDINIQQIGLVSGIPFIIGAISLIGGSILIDYLRNNKILSVLNVHRLFLSFGPLVGVMLTIIISMWRNFIVDVVCLTILSLLNIIILIPYDILPVDMGGQFSCFIMGSGLTFYGIGAALSTFVMGLIVTDHSATQWSVYFLVFNILNVWGAIIFYKFGSADLQPWAVPVENVKKVEQQSEKY